MTSRAALHCVLIAALVLAGAWIPPAASAADDGSIGMGAVEVVLGFPTHGQIGGMPAGVATTIRLADGQPSCLDARGAVLPPLLVAGPVPHPHAVAPHKSDPEQPGTGAAVR